MKPYEISQRSKKVLEHRAVCQQMRVLFELGVDTVAISKELKMSEAAVYNQLFADEPKKGAAA